MHYIAKNKTPYLVLLGEKGVARVMNMNSKECVFSSQEPPQPFLRYAYVKSGNKLVAVTTEQNLIFYELAFDEQKTPKLVHTSDCIGFHDEILDLAYDSPNSRIILATNSTLLKYLGLNFTHNRSTHIPTMQTKVLPGHDDIILTMHLNGSTLITGAKDNCIKLWRLTPDNIKCLATYKGHSKHVTSLFIAPKKQQFMVSGSKDLTIKVWKIVRDEKEEIITEAMRTVIGHQKEINVVRVSPNDKIIASGSQDRTIKVMITILPKIVVGFENFG